MIKVRHKKVKEFLLKRLETEPNNRLLMDEIRETQKEIDYNDDCQTAWETIGEQAMRA